MGMEGLLPERGETEEFLTAGVGSDCPAPRAAGSLTHLKVQAVDLVLPSRYGLTSAILVSKGICCLAAFFISTSIAAGWPQAEPLLRCALAWSGGRVLGRKSRQYGGGAAGWIRH